MYFPQYYQLPNITMGGYGHQVDADGNIQPVAVTIRYYQELEVNPSSGSIVLDRSVITSEQRESEHH